jgi:predicted RNA binding protein YcfA (HicA-like mRNA interferase family)
MPALPQLSGRETVRAFETLGWKVSRQKGSHIILVKDEHIAGGLMVVLNLQEIEKYLPEAP